MLAFWTCPHHARTLFRCTQVKSVLQQLTAMNPNPTIGLAEAAEMLCKHLGVSLVRCAHAHMQQT